MRLTKKEIVRFIITGLFLIAAAVIASLTIGRDIYYGSRDQGLLSFAIVSLSGYLFFLFIPVEVPFVYYVSGDINVWALNAIALSTAIVSESIDYMIGLWFSKDVITRLIGTRRYLKAENRIRKYGNLVIFIFNVTPLSSPVISLAAGMIRHPVKDAFIFTISGLTVKYIILTLIFN